MKTYQFQILHYRHDFSTQEFVNVGLVIYSVSEGLLKVQILNKYSRISNFFVGADGKYLKEKFKEIEQAIKLVAVELQRPDLFENTSATKSLATITENILPQDDGSFYFSEVHTRLDVSIETALGDIFDRYVHKHFSESSSSSTDEQVWKDIYKAYFDKYDFSSKLATHVVQTPDDEFEFARAWKNGIWNIYEPISFKLQDTQSIKNKVYKWAGKISELSHTSEELSLNFLSAMPDKGDLQKFIKNKLSPKEKTHLRIQIITEEDVEAFMENEQKKMLSH
ncbi:MAG: DUF3037 domain-containing protein [Bernardetiaceae bacterium]|nr:DUF3037 domain-containing protein [Bernardetiaceae bacterium]